ncbi:MAG: S1-like domain-containing RNA-binding protein [Acholeplasmataceae bacterium]|nr:S1-like domain-containing RNA-binding protein [Acholeplasmataceae bacterium]MDD4824532.1 S1-like domain-containing RNA-binding protein [Acholeplasmataceae bacterium]
MIIGDINKLKVDRKTDIGYMLSDGNEQVFLHNNETNHEELRDNQMVDAFLYYDFKGRLAATLSKPIITVNRAAFLEVVDVKRSLGVFVDNGVSKDLLVSKDDLPTDYLSWPTLGDKLYLTIKVKGRLVGRRPSKNEINLAHTNTVNENDKLSGFVIQIIHEGINVLTEDLHLVFVHQTQMRKSYRLGEKVDVKVIRVYEHTINGSLIKQKENMIHGDAGIILDYLENHGKMKFNNESSPEAIMETFKLSKKAFKRALGHLYKERLITFEGEYTIFIGGKDE